MARALANRYRFVSAIVNLSFLMGWASLGTAATITNIGSLGFGGTVAAAINDRGEIAGASSVDGYSIYHAILYSAGMMQDLGTLEPPLAPFVNAHSSAVGINDYGEVVGQSSTVSGAEHAFLYSAGTMHDLGALGTPRNSSTAWGINAGGKIVGNSEIEAGIRHAFLYADGKMQDLGTLPGDAESGATSINASGEIVGNSFTGAVSRAFLYSGSSMVDLGTLGGRGVEAAAINNHGLIVGDSIALDGKQYAFVYAAGKMHGLDGLGPHSYATAINNRGQIVGSGQNASGPFAFLYVDGVLTDLNSLLPLGSGWLLAEAAGINDAGQIIGEGTFHGLPAAFLMDLTATPIPEPGNMEPFGAAFALCALCLLLNKAKRTHL